eukprot:2628788-Alexandrium_andersonii.AAC.1
MAPEVTLGLERAKSLSEPVTALGGQGMPASCAMQAAEAAPSPCLSARATRGGARLGGGFGTGPR